MKRDRTYLLLLLLLGLLLSGCDRPKNIPDNDLRDIFKEIYLTNAYFSVIRQTNTDSLDTYRPILKKHGYTVKDLRYTIDNFSRRKSSNLSDILEQAINALKKEHNAYQAAVAVLDTIDSRAGRLFCTVVYQDSLIEARAARDTAKLRITIPASPGTYYIGYSYLIDSLDRNPSIRTTFILTDSAGNRKTRGTNWMSLRRRTRYNTEIETYSGDQSLQVVFGNYNKMLKTPSLRVDSLRIVHYLPRQEALHRLDSLLLQQYFPRYSYASLPDSLPPDSSALRVYPPRLDTERRSDRP